MTAGADKTASKVIALRDLGAMPLGGLREPPHNYEAEQGLLGTIIENNDALARVSGIVRAEDFADEIHGKIFAAILSLREHDRTADLVTLKGFFESDGSLVQIGGTEYLSRLVGSVVTQTNAGDYARIIRDLADRRRLIGLGNEMIERAYHSDVFADPTHNISSDLMDQCHALGAFGDGGKDFREIALHVVEEAKNPRRSQSTGLPSLDRCMGGGLQPGYCYGMLGRMKAGKTLIAGTVAHNLNRDGVKVAYIAGEMGGVDITRRMIARECGVNSRIFLSDSLWNNPELLVSMAQYAISAPKNLVFFDKPGMTASDVRECVKAAVFKHKVSGVIVDYLQLVRGEVRGQSKVEHLEQVAQWIADACRKWGVWGIILAQLNQDNGNTRWGEGLNQACDQLYAINDLASDPPEAWLEMRLSRYTQYQNAGSELRPAFRINMSGPFFEDVSDTYARAAAGEQRLKNKGVN